MQITYNSQVRIFPFHGTPSTKERSYVRKARNKKESPGNQLRRSHQQPGGDWESDAWRIPCSYAGRKHETPASGRARPVSNGRRYIPPSHSFGLNTKAKPPSQPKQRGQPVQSCSNFATPLWRCKTRSRVRKHQLTLHTNHTPSPMSPSTPNTIQQKEQNNNHKIGGVWANLDRKNAANHPDLFLSKCKANISGSAWQTNGNFNNFRSTIKNQNSMMKRNLADRIRQKSNPASKNPAKSDIRWANAHAKWGSSVESYPARIRSVVDLGMLGRKRGRRGWWERRIYNYLYIQCNKCVLCVYEYMTKKKGKEGLYFYI